MDCEKKLLIVDFCLFIEIPGRIRHLVFNQQSKINNSSEKA